MRNLLPITLLLGLAACGTPSHWEKPGVDQAVAGQDNTECRRAAQQEAFRSTPPFFPSYGRGWRGRPSYFGWSTFESDRFYTENRLAAFCMRSRGYELVPSEQPRTQAPPPVEK